MAKESVVSKPYRHILVPMDFSLHAMLALEKATDLARQDQAQLTVVQVSWMHDGGRE
jgi:nucleotide-binding universal stress UspA family protein